MGVSIRLRGTEQFRFAIHVLWSRVTEVWTSGGGIRTVTALTLSPGQHLPPPPEDIRSSGWPARETVPQYPAGIFQGWKMAFRFWMENSQYRRLISQYREMAFQGWQRSFQVWKMFSQGWMLAVQGWIWLFPCWEWIFQHGADFSQHGGKSCRYLGMLFPSWRLAFQYREMPFQCGVNSCQYAQMSGISLFLN